MASKKSKSKGKLPSGNYRVQVTVGKRADGTRRVESFTNKDKDVAEAEAKAFKVRMKTLLMQGVSVDDIPRDDVPVVHSDTVKTHLLRYVDTCEAVGLSPSTVREYESTAKRAYASIKSLPVHLLTISHVQDYVNARSKDGASPKTIRNEIGLLSAALQQARPDLNFKALKMPKNERPEIQIPTVEEVQKMIDEARGTELYVPLLLAALMGLRRSEIAALQWVDVDIKERTLNVRSAVVSGVSGLQTKGTKTRAGTRTLHIPQAVAKALAAQRGLDAAVTQLTPDAITRRYERMLEKLGMHYRFHDLRHYHASRMIANGAPQNYITADMGHATMDMVNRVYGHVMADKQKEIYEGMERDADAITI